MYRQPHRSPVLSGLPQVPSVSTLGCVIHLVHTKLLCQIQTVLDDINRNQLVKWVVQQALRNQQAHEPTTDDRDPIAAFESDSDRHL